MKRVLHINDSWDGGGAEAVFRDTIETSRELGYDNNVIVSNNKRNALSFIFSYYEYKKIKEKILTFKPDIIHIHNYYHYLSPSILMAIKIARKKFKWTGRVIFTAHDYHLICPNSGLQYFKAGNAYNFATDKSDFSLFKKFDRRGYFYSTLKLTQYLLNYNFLKLDLVIDKIVSPSHFLHDVFLKWGRHKDIHVIRNPIIRETKHKISKDTISGNGTIKLIFMGRVTYEKGIIQFIKKINKSKLKIEFHIYGSGELCKEIEKMHLRDGLKILLHGHIKRDALLAEISKFDIFVLPSIWYENAPLSILEAANLGLPVIVPNYGGLKEIAQLTFSYSLFDYEVDDIDQCLLEIIKKKNANFIIDPTSFTYEKYKNEIENLYGS